MKILTPLKAMRAKCLDCCCDQPYEVEMCACENNCPLWPYRMGKAPVGYEKTRSLSEAKGQSYAVFFNGEFIRTISEKTPKRAINLVKLIYKRKGMNTEGEWEAR